MVPSENEIQFNKLLTLFTQRSDHLYLLTKPHGKGYAQVFDLEKGLQARFWNFCFFNEREIYNDIDEVDSHSYFTLAFFLDTRGLVFAKDNLFEDENIIWNTIFISNLSNYRMRIAPLARGYCLGISFSRQWLDATVFRDNHQFNELKSKIDKGESFTVYESMNEHDKKRIEDLMNTSWKKALGSFYIKSYVLRLLSDFFYKVKDRDILAKRTLSPSSIISDVEKYLEDNVMGQLPNIKSLAGTFDVSERTLMRQFVKKHGFNISTYFMEKKMQYAHQLMEKEQMNTDEVALYLGYKNKNNFKRMFEKYLKVAS